MKAAVYAGTRNVYQDMIPSMKSLLIHSDVEKIYFLIEDDEFPYELPPEVECINVSNQEWFLPNGPNYNSTWSYMVLLRAAYAKIFSNLDIILSLDNDTIINDNISELWDIDITNYYIAGVLEPKKSIYDVYVNNGVLLYNLKKIREDKIDDKIIENLNTYYYYFAEQDCFNEVFSGKILTIPSDYNVNKFVKQQYSSLKIIHFAAIKNWQKFSIVKYYRNASIVRNQISINNLDIIIPFYKNLELLEQTLKSVYYPEIKNIKITVVDDCSELDYTDLKEFYPEVQFLKLPENSGPGIARQYGIDHTTNKYILFIDSGDYIITKFNLLEILFNIENNNAPYLYLYRWLNEEHNTYSTDFNPLLHGYIFKREFLNIYNISFSKEEPRLSEDFGFVQTCLTIIKDLEYQLNIKPFFVFKPTCILYYIYDPTSLSHLNKDLNLSKNQIKAITINSLHLFSICKDNNVSIPVLAQKSTIILVELLKWLDFSIKKHPEFTQENWQWIRKFYFEVYEKYEKLDTHLLTSLIIKNKNLIFLLTNKNRSLNIKNILLKIKECEEYPF